MLQLALAGTVVAALLLIAGRVPSTAPPALAASGALRVDPPTQTVASGDPFTVTITQHADVATLGAQTNFKFDPSVVQISSVEVGPLYHDALFLFGIVPVGSQDAGDISATIADANNTGVLLNLTTFFTPGLGSVPAGDAVFLTIQMQGISGGQSDLALPDLGQVSPIEMLDQDSNPIPVEASGGHVTVTGGPAAPAGPEGTPTVSRTGTPVTGTPTLTSAVRGISNATASLTMVPKSASVAVGDTTTIDLRVNLPVQASAVQADIAFDKSLLQITGVQPGDAWKQGKLFTGGQGQTLDQAMAAANQSGTIRGGVLLSSGSVGPGEQTVLTLTVRGLKDGKSNLKLANAEVVDAQGNTLKIDAKQASLVVGSGGGGGGFPILIVVLIVAVVLVAGGGGGFWFWRRRSAA